MKSPTSRPPGLPLGALMLGGIIIGLSPIFVRLSEVGPVATAFWRVALAVFPFLTWKLTSGETATADEKSGSLRDAVALIIPGLMLAGDLIAWHTSIRLTSVANASLLANMAPIFVTLGSWLLFGNTVTRPFLIGLALAVAGVAILNCGPGLTGQRHLGGDAVAVVASLFYAGYMLALSRLRKRHSTLTTMLWTSASAALCLLPVALVFEPKVWPTTVFAWTVVTALAWICHAGGQGLIIYALAKLPVSFSSLTLLIQPVVAAFIAWIAFSEALGAMQALGGGVILTGILVARRG